MKIGINLNDVLRAYTEQISYVYGKYMLYGLEEGVEDEDELVKIQMKRDKYDVTKNPIKNLDLMEYFDFASPQELNEFLFKEAPLEIFGHADELHTNLISHLNSFAMDIYDEEEHELELISRDVYMGIPATFFFLSKTACRVKQFRFVDDLEETWDGIDLLITANPTLLSNKPEGKTSIKINTTYNEDVEADYEFDSIIHFIKDEEKRNEILNNNINV